MTEPVVIRDVTLTSEQATLIQDLTNEICEELRKDIWPRWAAKVKERSDNQMSPITIIAWALIAQATMALIWQGSGDEDDFVRMTGDLFDCYSNPAFIKRCDEIAASTDRELFLNKARSFYRDNVQQAAKIRKAH